MADDSDKTVKSRELKEKDRLEGWQVTEEQRRFIESLLPENEAIPPAPEE